MNRPLHLVDDSAASGEPKPLPVLDYLQRQLAGTLRAGEETFLRYPTAISQLLKMRIVDIDEASATLEIDADAAIHGNQQGTVHGGLICELADAAFGTAHSTLMQEDESFTSIDLKATFLRPVWKSTLRARAWATHRGRTISHYQCDIARDDGKLVATVTCAVMTLRGAQAQGR
ncbi:MAG: PaaI family thioesterase [Rudaea sp.]|uniref:PaaI family thioesterase n=1 Tax=unclassified Rudaea TaxID=2627037 RepID=UPI0010F6AA92|nr:MULTISPECIES: PaaI family thioesterase [unclassified Rudaea]MBN8887785.1 PaaI family thioesterase [Rudaea sp.]MBR0344806.1 PaaI family thioesterase [Rudaea sp.]